MIKPLYEYFCLSNIDFGSTKGGTENGVQGRKDMSVDSSFVRAEQSRSDSPRVTAEHFPDTSMFDNIHIPCLIPPTRSRCACRRKGGWSG